MDPTFVIPSRHHLNSKLTPDAVAAKTAESFSCFPVMFLLLQIFGRIAI